VTLCLQKRGWPVSIVGTQATGWEPADPRATPQQPARRVLMDVKIEEDAGSYLLVYAAEDRSVYGDSWHASLEEAEAVAEQWLGLRRDDWESAGPA